MSDNEKLASQMTNDNWGGIKNHLEPACRHFYTDPYNDIQISIAISLKRIADSLEQPKIEGVDIVMPELSPEQIQAFKDKWDKAND